MRVVVVLIMVGFTTSLGTYASLRSQLTWKARMWTLGILIAPHVCCMLPLPSILTLVGFSLWSYAEIHALWSGTLGFEQSVSFCLPSPFSLEEWPCTLVRRTF